MTNEDASSWALQYIGRPWIAGERGPESFDCWGLFLWIQKMHFGRDLPLIPVDALNLRTVLHAFQTHPERQRWVAVDVPTQGDAVLMRQSRHPVHVGVWVDVDGSGVLHCAQQGGVVFQQLRSLANHGWQVEGFYRWKESP